MSAQQAEPLQIGPLPLDAERGRHLGGADIGGEGDHLGHAQPAPMGVEIADPMAPDRQRLNGVVAASRSTTPASSAIATVNTLNSDPSSYVP